jgi:hypothetical protein
MRIPEEWQLLSVFEVEPTVLDPGVPWAYNMLTFETTRGEDRVRCEIAPGYDEFRFVWTRDGDLILKLDLRRVSGLLVHTEKGSESLCLEFSDDTIGPLVLQLKPKLTVSFSTNDAL